MMFAIILNGGMGSSRIVFSFPVGIFMLSLMMVTWLGLQNSEQIDLQQQAQSLFVNSGMDGAF